MKRLNLIGHEFGKLTVIEETSEHICKKRLWKCQCECGNITYVSTSNLRCNRVKSCGCLKTIKLIERSSTHKQRHTKIYEVWKTMKQRCNNPKNVAYKNYGGRGITICQEWNSDFSSFYDWSMNNGYKQGLTIDRINVNGNYEPSNCRWTDRITQANNTRSNKYITINNETKSLADWCRTYNQNYSKVSARLHSTNDILYALDLKPKD